MYKHLVSLVDALSGGADRPKPGPKSPVPKPLEPSDLKREWKSKEERKLHVEKAEQAELNKHTKDMLFFENKETKCEESSGWKFGQLVELIRYEDAENNTAPDGRFKALYLRLGELFKEEKPGKEIKEALSKKPVDWDSVLKKFHAALRFGWITPKDSDETQFNRTLKLLAKWSTIYSKPFVGWVMGASQQDVDKWYNRVVMNVAIFGKDFFIKKYPATKKDNAQVAISRQRSEDALNHEFDVFLSVYDMTNSNRDPKDLLEITDLDHKERYNLHGAVGSARSIQYLEELGANENSDEFEKFKKRMLGKLSWSEYLKSQTSEAKRLLETKSQLGVWTNWREAILKDRHIMCRMLMNNEHIREQITKNGAIFVAVASPDLNSEYHEIQGFGLAQIATFSEKEDKVATAKYGKRNGLSPGDKFAVLDVICARRDAYDSHTAIRLLNRVEIWAWNHGAKFVELTALPSAVRFYLASDYKPGKAGAPGPGNAQIDPAVVFKNDTFADGIWMHKFLEEDKVGKMYDETKNTELLPKVVKFAVPPDTFVPPVPPAVTAGPAAPTDDEKAEEERAKLQKAETEKKEREDEAKRKEALKKKEAAEERARIQAERENAEKMAREQEELRIREEELAILAKEIDEAERKEAEEEAKKQEAARVKAEREAAEQRAKEEEQKRKQAEKEKKEREEAELERQKAELERKKQEEAEIARLAEQGRLAKLNRVAAEKAERQRRIEEAERQEIERQKFIAAEAARFENEEADRKATREAKEKVDQEDAEKMERQNQAKAKTTAVATKGPVLPSTAAVARATAERRASEEEEDEENDEEADEEHNEENTEEHDEEEADEEEEEVSKDAKKPEPTSATKEPLVEINIKEEEKKYTYERNFVHQKMAEIPKGENEVFDVSANQTSIKCEIDAGLSFPKLAEAIDCIHGAAYFGKDGVFDGLALGFKNKVKKNTGLLNDLKNVSLSTSSPTWKDILQKFSGTFSPSEIKRGYVKPIPPEQFESERFKNATKQLDSITFFFKPRTSKLVTDSLRAIYMILFETWYLFVKNPTREAFRYKELSLPVDEDSDDASEDYAPKTIHSFGTYQLKLIPKAAYVGLELDAKQKDEYILLTTEKFKRDDTYEPHAAEKVLADMESWGKEASERCGLVQAQVVPNAVRWFIRSGYQMGKIGQLADKNGKLLENPPVLFNGEELIDGIWMYKLL